MQLSLGWHLCSTNKPLLGNIEGTGATSWLSAACESCSACACLVSSECRCAEDQRKESSQSLQPGTQMGMFDSAPFTPSVLQTHTQQRRFPCINTHTPQNKHAPHTGFFHSWHTCLLTFLFHKNTFFRTQTHPHSSLFCQLCRCMSFFVSMTLQHSTTSHNTFHRDSR